jgi:hypothetical protein
MQEAITLLHHELSEAVQTICADLDACLGSTPQQQQRQLRSSSGSNAGTDTAALEQLFVVLSLVTSPSFRSSVVSEELIESLARCACREGRGVLADSCGQHQVHKRRTGDQSRVQRLTCALCEETLLSVALQQLPAAFCVFCLPGVLERRYLLAAAASDGQEQSARDEAHMSNFRSTLMQVLEAVSQVRVAPSQPVQRRSPVSGAQGGRWHNSRDTVTLRLAKLPFAIMRCQLIRAAARVSSAMSCAVDTVLVRLASALMNTCPAP